MRKVIIAILVIVMVFSFTACGTKNEPASNENPTTTPQQSEDTTENDASKPEKIIIATGEWAPYTSESMDGKGFMSEIVAAIMDDMGLDYEVKFYPWERCEKMVENDFAWATFPYAKNDERQAKYLFSESMGNASPKFFYNKNNKNASKFKFDSYDDIRNYKIGASIGSFYVETFKEENIDVELVENEEQGMKMLINGRIDLYPINDLAAATVLKESFPDEIKNIVAIDKPLNPEAGGLHMMASKTYPESQKLINDFNKSLENIKTNGKLDEILVKYNIK